GCERRVDEDGLLAEQLRHPRLREQDAAVAHPRRAARSQHARRQPPPALDLSLRARTGRRVDRPALPGDAAKDRASAVGPARLRGGERAHHVPTRAPPRPTSQAISAWRSRTTQVASASAGAAPTPIAPCRPSRTAPRSPSAFAAAAAISSLPLGAKAAVSTGPPAAASRSSVPVSSGSPRKL